MQIHRSIGQQLAFYLLLAMALVAATAWTSFRAVSQVGESLTQVHRVALPAVDYLDQADRDLQQLLVAERSLLATEPGDALRAKYTKEFDDNVRQSRERLESFVPSRAILDSIRCTQGTSRHVGAGSIPANV